MAKAVSVGAFICEDQAMTDPKATAMVLTPEEAGELQNEVAGLCIDAWQSQSLNPYEMGDIFLAWYEKKTAVLRQDLAASRQQAEEAHAREKAMRSEADQAQAGRMEWFNKHEALLDRLRVLERAVTLTLPLMQRYEGQGDGGMADFNIAMEALRRAAVAGAG